MESNIERAAISRTASGLRPAARLGSAAGEGSWSGEAGTDIGEPRPAGSRRRTTRGQCSGCGGVSRCGSGAGPGGFVVVAPRNFQFPDPLFKGSIRELSHESGGFGRFPDFARCPETKQQVVGTPPARVFPTPSAALAGGSGNAAARTVQRGRCERPLRPATQSGISRPRLATPPAAPPMVSYSSLTPAPGRACQRTPAPTPPRRPLRRVSRPGPLAREER